MAKSPTDSEIMEMAIARLVKVGIVDYKDGIPLLVGLPGSVYTYVYTFLAALSKDPELRNAIRERWFSDV